MSMTCKLLAVSGQEFEFLLQNPDSILDTFFPDDGVDRPPDRHLDLDKSWHVLHYLLNGDPWEGEPPLSNAILGGSVIGDDTGYGPPRYLTRDEVKAVAGALAGLSRAALAARYDASALDAADVYPQIWDPDEHGVRDWLLEHFDELAKFYRVAAAEGRVIFICIS